MKLLVTIFILSLTLLVPNDRLLNAKEKEVAENTDSTLVLYDFHNNKEISKCFAINDNVMGGISTGGVSPPRGNSLNFSGSLSLENNGGFASIRSQPKDFNLSGYQGIRIRVKGDGRIYQFRLRIDRKLDGIAFKHEFETVDNTWIELDLSFDSFIPTYCGRTLRDVKPLEAADIRQLGFLLADKKAGAFNLLVDKIVAFK